MNSIEPSGYEDEPRELFEPLPPDLYSQLYHYERLNQELASERLFYRQLLSDRCRRLLELGCGSCLLAGDLHRHGFSVTGVDFSRYPLLLAKKTSTCSVVQMDIRNLGFKPSFEAVLIPQNTLNLLLDEKTISQCLQEVRRILTTPGLLLAHLYCFNAEQAQPDRKFLQFSIFDHPEGGKIIKETIRSYAPGNDRLILDERFKIRRFSPAHRDVNYRHTLQLAAFTRERWLKIFRDAGFAIRSSTSAFSTDGSASNSTLLLVAQIAAS